MQTLQVAGAEGRDCVVLSVHAHALELAAPHLAQNALLGGFALAPGKSVKQTVSLTSLGGQQLVAANVEREWLCHDGLPCVRVLLGGGVDREGQNTLLLVEG